MLSLFFPLWVEERVGGGGAFVSAPGLVNAATAVAALLVVFSAPVFGAVADFRQRRVPYLAAMTLAAVALTAALDRAGGVAVGLAVFVAADLAYQSALVFYNALLPAVSAGRGEGRVSGYGTAAGYVGTILALLILTFFVENGETLRSKAPLVVAADGIGGFAAEGMKAHQNAVARRQYFKDVAGPNKEDLHVFLTRDMNEHGAGYGWIFHFGDGRANVGAGVSTKTLSHTGRNLKDFFDRFLEEPEVARHLEGAEAEGPAKSWSLKMGMWGAKRYAQGLMTVGDAASMIHPISGEGVGYAIESGRLAAAWAHEARSRNDYSASLLSGYGRQLRRKRSREHLSGYALTNLVPNLAMLEPFFKACEKDPNSRLALIEGFTGDAPIYSLLKHPRTLARAASTALSHQLSAISKGPR